MDRHHYDTAFKLMNYELKPKQFKKAIVKYLLLKLRQDNRLKKIFHDKIIFCPTVPNEVTIFCGNA